MFLADVSSNGLVIERENGLCAFWNGGCSGAVGRRDLGRVAAEVAAALPLAR